MNTFVIVAAAVLSVPKVDLGPAPEMKRVDEMMEAGEVPLHEIGQVNWPGEFPDRPLVRFRIAHSGGEIYLKFYVEEDATRAVWGADNGRPWEDSCVEFFVSADSPEGAGGADGTDSANSVDSAGPVYFNLEMSCIGFGILHGGAPGARGPVEGGAGGVEKVRRLASMPSEPFGVREGRQTWTLTLAIPVELFAPAIEGPLDGRTLRANFYKCGDGLPRPHYLSWSPIDTPAPSFHQPRFFGRLFFE